MLAMKAFEPPATHATSHKTSPRDKPISLHDPLPMQSHAEQRERDEMEQEVNLLKLRIKELKSHSKEV